ncbi:MAG: tRNA pseudouridine synthase A [Pseudohongiella sp.]|nr:MAG: tRNA pseudouridine synthase A [Pseudohongiella sp.]
MGIEYDGAAYSGWQKQKLPQQETVQQHIEAALSKVADSDVVVSCAGRTDAGVHATCQVVHFDSEIDRGERAWTQGVNSLLPRSIRVRWAKGQHADFHARFSALSRRYLYLTYRRDSESVMLRGRATHTRRELDADAMQEAAQHFLGEQNFSSVRAAGCQSKTAMRNVMHANIYRQGGFLIFDVKANAFLQHMVRNMMGSLLKVGRGERDPAWIAELMSLRDRTQAAPTALPDGLYLVGVEYPPDCDLPSEMSYPDLLLAR